MPPAPPSPRSASRRTSSQHRHSRRRPSWLPPLLPSSLTPERKQPPHTVEPAVERHRRAANFSLHHGAASDGRVPACGVSLRPHATARHGGRTTPGGWRSTAEPASTTWQPEAALLGTDAGGGGWLAGALSTYSGSLSSSWPRLPVLGSPACGLAAGYGDHGRTVFQFPSGVDEDSTEPPCLQTRKLHRSSHLHRAAMV